MKCTVIWAEVPKLKSLNHPLPQVSEEITTIVSSARRIIGEILIVNLNDASSRAKS